MSGVKLSATTGSFLTTTNDQTLLQVFAASANHGALIYRIQIDVNPNTISAPAVAQYHIEKQSDAGSVTGAVTAYKTGSDPETVQTTCSYKATSEPTLDSIISAKRLATFGGTSITTILFNFPRGLKLDGGERIGVVQVLAATPSPYPKISVSIDLEE
jgi:hypothetical protein|tara:strand:- start:419 stop:892 length:474 start_codon:yes stop_codon:yes gene_type:complete